jgi:hypothetical protein
VTVLLGQNFSYLTVTARWSSDRWVCRCDRHRVMVPKVAQQTQRPDPPLGHGGPGLAIRTGLGQRE